MTSSAPGTPGLELFAALERVQAGDSIRDTFPMAPERREEFEAWRAARAGR